MVLNGIEPCQDYAGKQYLTAGTVVDRPSAFWTLIRPHPPQDLLDDSESVDRYLSTAMHARRVACLRLLDDLSPGALVVNATYI
jgi:hypothetical protein